MVSYNNEQDGSEGRAWRRQILPLDCDYEVELGEKMNGSEKYHLWSQQQTIAANSGKCWKWTSEQLLK